MITIPLGDYPALRRAFFWLLDFLHIVLTLVMAWWSLCMFWPNDLFSGSLSFHVFAELMSKTNWAIFFAIVAAIGLWGSISMREATKVISSAALASAHAGIAALIALSEHGSTGIGAYIALAAIGYANAAIRTLVRVG